MTILNKKPHLWKPPLKSQCNLNWLLKLCTASAPSRPYLNFLLLFLGAEKYTWWSTWLCFHPKDFINVVFVVNFCHLAILFFKKKTFFCFDILNNLLNFLSPWHNQSIVTPLIHDKTNTTITMSNAMEYAIHTHYTQFFWNFNSNFKRVAWTWNQFIFQFWKFLFCNRNILFLFWIFLFAYESSYINSENYYFNLNNWFSIM